jgi:hypothetical protein
MKPFESRLDELIQNRVPSFDFHEREEGSDGEIDLEIEEILYLRKFGTTASLDEGSSQNVEQQEQQVVTDRMQQVITDQEQQLVTNQEQQEVTDSEVTEELGGRMGKEQRQIHPIYRVHVDNLVNSKKWYVDDIKDELKKRNIDANGKKCVLRERLEKAMLEEKNKGVLEEENEKEEDFHELETTFII